MQIDYKAFADNVGKVSLVKPTPLMASVLNYITAYYNNEPAYLMEWVETSYKEFTKQQILSLVNLIFAGSNAAKLRKLLEKWKM